MGLPTLTPHQEDAVEIATDWFRSTDEDNNEFYLAGYAGTGKSTILPVIIDSIGIDPDSIKFVAPTGKAAKVMSSKLRQFGITNKAKTIHSTIYRPRKMKADQLEMELIALNNQRDGVLSELHEKNVVEWEKHPDMVELDRSIQMVKANLEKTYDIGEKPTFQLNIDSDIRKARLIVCDEASMVGDEVATDLRSFGIPILAMGDPGQLPPVGDTPGLTAREADFFLTEIHRQAKDNPITMLATRVRNGESLKPGVFGGDVRVVRRIDDVYTYDLDREAQILVGTNKRRWMITSKLRSALGYTSTGPMEGEPLIVCKNSKNIPEVVNGSFVNCAASVGDLKSGNIVLQMKIALESDGEDENIIREISALQCLFEEHHLKTKGAATGDSRDVYYARRGNEHLDWGWAITCHKAQGSEWDEVIVHDESNVFKADAAKWLYTAITRAKRKLTIVI